MNDETMARWSSRAPWLLMPVVAFAAFAIGTCLGGPSGGSATGAHAGHEHDSAASTWTCSMHPQIRQGDPGQCPICGMDLIVVSAANDAAAASPSTVTLSERSRIKARIRTTPVERLDSAVVERHLLGRVDYDETSLRTVTAWVGGRIDRLQVRVTGERVRRGQAIASLYSPEVYSAHQDLIQAAQQLGRFGSGTSATSRSAAEAGLRAARDRLRLLGVPDGELKRMEGDARPSEQIQIRTPFAGTVIERMATEGAYVATGSGLYRIADLSRVWVQLDAYESDLQLLQRGQEVTLQVEALPGETFTGRVTFVDPILNQRTRTARVRIEVKNRDHRLRPGMFAEAIVRSRPELGEAAPLVVPESAPLFTGRRSIVYVERQLDSGTAYEARPVRLGAKRGAHYPVVSGLTLGERVVTHGAFALDADLQIRGGISMMAAPDDNDEGTFVEIVPVPKAHAAALAKVFESYLGVHTGLAADDLAGAQSAAKTLAASADALEPQKPGAFGEAWAPVARLLSVHAAVLAGAAGLDQARVPFRDLSQQVATMLRVFGNPTGDTLRLAFCPMALGSAGAEWVQRSATIENPYFGESMHSCGEVHSAVTHGTYLPAGDTPTKTAPPPADGHQH